MRKELFALLVVLTVVCNCSSLVLGGSVEEIEIISVKVLESFNHADFFISGIALPIGFQVWCNGNEVTEKCEIDSSRVLFSNERILIVPLPKLVGTYNITILFYDRRSSVIFTEFVDVLSIETEIDWMLTGIVFGSLIFFIVIGSLFVPKSWMDHAESKHSEMKNKIFIALFISIALFAYTALNPYFNYPQIINFFWCEVYRDVDYFSRAALYLAIVGFSYHSLRYALGKEKKRNSKPKTQSLTKFQYFFRSVIGGKDSINDEIIKERRPSFAALAKISLIVMLFFTTRILMLMLFSTLYKYFPKNFMLVTRDNIPNHSVFSWINLICQILSIVFLICCFISIAKFSFATLHNLNQLSTETSDTLNKEEYKTKTFEEEEHKIDIKKKTSPFSLRWFILSMIFYVLYFGFAKLTELT